MSYRRVLVDLIMTYHILHLGDFPMLTPMLHLRGPCSTRGHRYKLVVPDVKRVPHPLFFEQRVINIWNNLPQHMIELTSVNQFKALLDLSFTTIRFRELWYTYDGMSYL
ncbi:unnamed protein product [Dicrocoelium dendriticum]|nr:unnamed protein product [Dicrocoelium dendriticum]